MFDVTTKVEANSNARVVTESPVKLKGGKKNPFQGRVTKVVEYDDVIFTGRDTFYNDMEKTSGEPVERKDRAWGVRVGDSPYIEHKETTYIEFLVKGDSRTTYFIDGDKVDNPTIIDGLDNPVELHPAPTKTTIRCMKMENISSIDFL